MKAKEIQELIDFIAKSGLDEVNIETEQFKIKVKKSSEVKTKIIEKASPTISATVPVAAAPAETAPVADQEAAETDSRTPAPTANGYVEIKSPMIGTFYRSSSPDADEFVKVGDKVTKGQTVCIIEAMKLFNEIESEVSGTVAKVLIENSSPVEYDQPLFLVDPS
ncbi:MAG: acetyl-CoA carboxylase biotin carboxyl carrier protein [Cyclobacteriaceae bacterium]